MMRCPGVASYHISPGRKIGLTNPAFAPAQRSPAASVDADLTVSRRWKSLIKGCMLHAARCNVGTGLDRIVRAQDLFNPHAFFPPRPTSSRVQTALHSVLASRNGPIGLMSLNVVDVERVRWIPNDSKCARVVQPFTGSHSGEDGELQDCMYRLKSWYAHWS